MCCLVDSLDHTYGKKPKLLEQYEWYSLQKKYKILVHTITFYIIVFNQQKLKNAGVALVITITSFSSY